MGREYEKVLRLRKREVLYKSAEFESSDSGSELDSNASGSDQFDLEIDMVDQPSHQGMPIFLLVSMESVLSAQSSSSAIVNERRKKKRKSDNTKKRSPLPEKRKRRRRVVIDDDEDEKEDPDDSDAISTINFNLPEVKQNFAKIILVSTVFS